MSFMIMMLLFWSLMTISLCSCLDYGDPLFLTPFVKEKKIEDARDASFVKPLKSNLKSFSGYLTVNSSQNTTLFFWFFPSENNNQTDPFVLWLQGNPGRTSLDAILNQVGPFYIKPLRGMGARDLHWSLSMNMLFIDYPAGSGFSFTNQLESTDEIITTNLYEALSQFLTIFSEFKTNDFYIAGQGYGGKIAVSLGYLIHTTGSKIAQFKGIAIGNGFLDPINTLSYTDYISNIGLIDDNVQIMFKKKQIELLSYIKESKFGNAFQSFQSLIGDIKSSLFKNTTYYNYIHNYLHPNPYFPYGNMSNYVQGKDVFRRSIHAGNLPFDEFSKDVENALSQQILKPQNVIFIQTLLNNYKVMFYNGQLDLLVPYITTINYLKTIKWDGSQGYMKAQRKPWYIGAELVGYTKTVNKFVEVLIINAGHYVATDQPKVTMDLMLRFMNDKKF